MLLCRYIPQAVPYWVDDESVRPSMLLSAPAVRPADAAAASSSAAAGNGQHVSVEVQEEVRRRLRVQHPETRVYVGFNWCLLHCQSHFVGGCVLNTAVLTVRAAGYIFTAMPSALRLGKRLQHQPWYSCCDSQHTIQSWSGLQENLSRRPTETSCRQGVY